LDSIERADQPYAGETEIIVALNRCTDRTADIAEKRGAIIVKEDAKNLSTGKFIGGGVVILPETLNQICFS
jgi:glycosyltransferase involved in cell wall biosynthesis